MTQQRTVLGRGLSALLPDADPDTPTANPADGHLVMIPLEHIQAAENQPRTHFDAKIRPPSPDSRRWDGTASLGEKKHRKYKNMSSSWIFLTIIPHGYYSLYGESIQYTGV